MGYFLVNFDAQEMSLTLIEYLLKSVRELMGLNVADDG